MLLLLAILFTFALQASEKSEKQDVNLENTVKASEKDNENTNVMPVHNNSPISPKRSLDSQDKLPQNILKFLDIVGVLFLNKLDTPQNNKE